ncbi:MAG: pilus assembly protein [Actinomycetota bacterium]|nr:pilus assembly protein [Actinomycetota bacterium]
MTAGERGATTTELAIVFPVLVAVVLAVVQFGIWYHAAAVARAAASEGVRAMLVVDGTDADGRRRTQEFLDQLGRGVIEAPTVATSRSDDVAVVEIRASAPELLPGLRLPVSARAETPLERFRAADER